MTEEVKILKTCPKCGGAVEINIAFSGKKEGTLTPARKLGIKWCTCEGELID